MRNVLGWVLVAVAFVGLFALGWVVAKRLGYESTEMAVLFGILAITPLGVWPLIEDKMRAREDRRRWLKPPTP